MPTLLFTWLVTITLCAAQALYSLLGGLGLAAVLVLLLLLPYIVVLQRRIQYAIRIFLVVPKTAAQTVHRHCRERSRAHAGDEVSPCAERNGAC